MNKQNKSIQQMSGNEIPEDVKELIAEAGDERTVLKTLEIAERFSGPIPHPKILREYAAIMPDAPDRIFSMAENQQAHRMELEKSVIKSDIHRADTGLILGFILLFVFSAGSIFLLAVGKNIEGFTLFGTSLLGGIANFIKVSRERTRISEEPRKTEPAKNITSKSDPSVAKKRKRRKNKK